MSESIETHTLDFAGHNNFDGAQFNATCPICGVQIVVSQFGLGRSICRCGRVWRLDMRATAGVQYSKLGPNEVK